MSRNSAREESFSRLISDLFLCVFCRGRNLLGQLGNGDMSAGQWKPALIKDYGEFFAEVACGENHTGAVGFDGNVYMWGSNRSVGWGSGERTARS